MEYESNSKNVTGPLGQGAKPKTPAKDIQKVVTGEVISKKPPLGRRMKEVFFGGDLHGVVRFVTADVLLPALRNLVVDSVELGVKRMMFGENMSRRRREPEFRSRVQYNNPIQRESRQGVYLPDQPPHPYRQNRHEANEIIISSREEAELVLERLIDITERYEAASLADLYDLVGLPSSHTDNKWGWRQLSNVSVRQLREGYLLELPIMEPI